MTEPLSSPALTRRSALAPGATSMLAPASVRAADLVTLGVAFRGRWRPSTRPGSVSAASNTTTRRRRSVA